MGTKRKKTTGATEDETLSSWTEHDQSSRNCTVIRTHEGPEIKVLALDLITTEIRLESTMPLICHKFSEKAKKQMLDKMMKTPNVGRAAKDPRAEFLGSLYTIKPGDENGVGGEYGFPASGFKKACVSAARYVEGVPMTVLRGAFQINSDLVTILTPDGTAPATPIMREDPVRLNLRSTDIRYRAEFREWSVTLSVTYNARAISLEELVNLLEIAGFAVGVGEWRPEKSGQFGRWQVAREAARKVA